MARRSISFLFALLVLTAAAMPLMAAEKQNKYLLISIILQPLQSHSLTLTESQEDCLAQGKAFLDWADKAEVSAGFNCLEIVPGSKPKAKLDKDGKPIHFQKERDL